MPDPAPPRRRRFLRFLAIHDDATARLAVKRLLERVAHAEVIGAGTPAAALDRLAADEVGFDVVLMDWNLPAWGALSLVFGLSKVHLSTRPRLFAFSSEWQDDDVARALQLKVDAFFETPVDPRRVIEELAASEKGVPSESRARMVERMGEAALEPCPELWPEERFPDWERQLAAVQEPEAASGVEQLVLAALDRAAGWPIGVTTAEALKAIEEKGQVAYREVADRHGLGHSRLRRLYRVATAAIRAAHVAEPLSCLDALIACVRARAQTLVASRDFTRFQEAATAFLLKPLPDAHAFAAVLARALGVELRTVLGVPPLVLRRAAAHVVNEPVEARALDLVRLTLLAHVLRGAPAEEVDVARLEALAALLRVDEGAEQVLGPWVMAASKLEVAPFEGDQASRVRQSVARLGAEGFGAVTERLELMQRSLGPGGDVAELRIADVVDAVERGETVALSQPTWSALAANLALPSAERGEWAPALWRALGGLNRAVDEERVRIYLEGLAPGDHLDTEDLRRVVAAAGSPARLRDLRRSEPREDTGPLAGMDPYKAMAIKACAAALIRESAHAQSPEERRALARRFVEQHGGGHQSFPPLIQLLNAGGERALAASIRGALGLGAGPARPSLVHELTAAGNLRGAVAGSVELVDEDLKTVPTLDELGRALLDAGEPDEAVTIYDRAIGIQPRRLVLRLNKARTLLGLGDRDEARRLLTELREVMPGFGDSDALWAQLEGAAGRP